MRLEQAELAALAPADRDRYRALEQLFAQPGWKVVMALAKENAALQVQRAAFADNWAANRMAIGMGGAWNEIAKLEETTEAFYLNLIAQSADRVAAEDEIAFE